MVYSRRDFARLALAVPVAGVGAPFGTLRAAQSSSRAGARFGSLNVGVIAPYSFRALANTDADALLTNVVQLGLGAVELQSTPAEAFAGAPIPPPTGVPFGQPLNAEQQARQTAAFDALREWRLSASMEKYRELRRKYESAGVKIDLIKFDRLNADWPAREIDYAFEVAKTLGCRGITCEPPLSHTRRLAAFADRHRLMLGYHGHVAVTAVEAFARPGSWEQAFFYSKFNGANIDIGHFTAGNNISPVEFIRQYHDRITNLHLKDRKKNNGPNVPWGEGDTPIREVLQLMKRETYGFMATIELEYPIPQGSDTMTELARCVRFVEEALATT
jgi:sugar phosphate isomerase/epimerase